MAEVFIYWHEIEDGAFPDCCMTCGAEDTELVPRKLMTTHWRVLSTLYRYITVDLPFCRAHASRPWVRWGRTDAKAFMDDGVWIKNVSPIFAEEMDAFREEEERYEERRRRRKHKRKRRREREDRDEDRPYFQDTAGPPQRPSSGAMTGCVIVTLLAAPILVAGLCCGGSFFIPGLWQFNVQPAPPPPRPGPIFHNPPPRGPIGPVGPIRDRRF